MMECGVYRRFKQHLRRQVFDLNGIWDFVFLGDVEPEDVGDLAYDDRMAVPGCFDATPAYAGKRGLTAYRTGVTVSEASTYRLVLDGVHHWSRVVVNGEALCDHIGGFTQFLTPPVHLEPGDVEIVVLVDNRLDYARTPLHLDYYDWYHFGGIARGVELHKLGSAWIDRVRVITEDYATRRIRLSVDHTATDQPVSVRVDDGPEVRLDAGQTEIDLTLDGAALWSPDAPHLHMLHVTLGDDDMRVRFGIRQVRAGDGKIFINDQPVVLRGFNRHESHPQFGHALPASLLVTDVQLLRDMGCNFVRGSHYPQDNRFLDLCDELGLLVWNEAIGWQQKVEHLTDPHYINAQLTNIEEMVAGAYNHPSVIMWGVLNEGDSHVAACRPAYEQLLGRIRELDSTRLITFASNHPFDDVCLDLVDVTSINCYPGWYHGTIDDIPAHLDSIVTHLDKAGYWDKPLIISEIGAGAIYGWRDVNQDRWSEQYQARLLETVIRHMFVDHDHFAGLAIWQFCDIRTAEASHRALGRPRTFNNKGVVDEYRRPKLVYDVVKRLFNQ